MSRSKLSIWFVVCLLVGAPGCKDGNQAENGEAAAKVPAVDDLAGGEDDLLARRDALLAARNRVRKERTDLSEKLREARAKGSDTAELVARADQLEAEEKRISDEEGQLNESLDAFLRERGELLKQLAAQASAQNRAGAVQTVMVSREKDLASRESRLAKREAELARREATLAKREKETCGVGGGTTIIQAPASPSGSKYRKRDVEPMLRRARRDMSKKGILQSDLPAAVRALESEATKAMAKGDYGRAHFAAAQLLASVRGIRVNKNFIAAKINRLNRAIKGKKLSASKNGEVTKLFRQATANFGDGRFSTANGRLNKIHALIR
ncbi:MAG: hypothetical protein KJO07_09935 [Deltaproteobacteria bacterium]|nr:hypothetical protein [Deltaproteobacteria bacterium]